MNICKLYEMTWICMFFFRNCSNQLNRRPSTQPSFGFKVTICFCFCFFNFSLVLELLLSQKSVLHEFITRTKFVIVYNCVGRKPLSYREWTNWLGCVVLFRFYGIQNGTTKSSLCSTLISFSATYDFCVKFRI